MENNKKNEKKRSENLSTSIGDLLKSQGNNILETKKPKNNKNKKYKKQNKSFKEKVKDSGKLITPLSEEEKKRIQKEKADKSLKEAIDKAVENGVLTNNDNVIIKMEEPSKEVVIEDSNWDDFSKAFLAEPEKTPESPNKITIGCDYITFSNNDARVKTSDYISK